MSIAEIVEEIGYSYSTVRKSLFEAKRLWRLVLGDEFLTS